VASKNKNLRSGYTTGACAAAAAKAATMILLSGESVNRLIGKSQNKQSPSIHPFTHSPIYREIEIPFPDGSRHTFKIHNSQLITHNSQLVARATVIKDAGDDPDVTNGAEISATVRLIKQRSSRAAEQQNKDKDASVLTVKGGEGIGIVTKPGLAIPVGEAAINPVPRKMIKEAVMEAITESGELVNRLIGKPQKPSSSHPIHPFTHSPVHQIEITISVPDGEKLAKKTLNSRLGIIGGISILGTTGIVKPISAEAWTATITSSMDVAKAMGRSEIVLSAGRSSEKAHMNKFNLPQESYVMMGDYLEFALLEAKKHGFKKIHLCAQWAKMLKIAMATPQTHVRHGAIDIKKAVEFLRSYQPSAISSQPFNTAMEIFEFLRHPALNAQRSALLKAVCIAAKKYAESIASEIPVISYLVSYEGEIIAQSE